MMGFRFLTHAGSLENVLGNHLPQVLSIPNLIIILSLILIITNIDPYIFVMKQTNLANYIIIYVYYLSLPKKTRLVCSDPLY